MIWLHRDNSEWDRVVLFAKNNDAYQQPYFCFSSSDSSVSVLLLLTKVHQAKAVAFAHQAKAVSYPILPSYPPYAPT